MYSIWIMGGIYEDGTPDQIFDNPQKERTRKFIRHLKALEYSITSQDFDFIVFNTQIEEFGKVIKAELYAK